MGFARQTIYIKKQRAYILKKKVKIEPNPGRGRSVGISRIGLLYMRFNRLVRKPSSDCTIGVVLQVILLKRFVGAVFLYPLDKIYIAKFQRFPVQAFPTDFGGNCTGFINPDLKIGHFMPNNCPFLTSRNVAFARPEIWVGFYLP